MFFIRHICIGLEKYGKYGQKNYSLCIDCETSSEVTGYSYSLNMRMSR